jgi:hypothetical protein
MDESAAEKSPRLCVRAKKFVSLYLIMPRICHEGTQAQRRNKIAVKKSLGLCASVANPVLIRERVGAARTHPASIFEGSPVRDVTGFAQDLLPARGLNELYEIIHCR